MVEGEKEKMRLKKYRRKVKKDDNCVEEEISEDGDGGK